MAEVSLFTRHVSAMCARRMLSVYDLGKRLSIDPKELLDMINGKEEPKAKIVRGLARELGIDEGYPEKLAVEMRGGA